MRLNRAIFDNTVFNFLVRIQSIDLENVIRSIISDSVLVPNTVLVEMERITLQHPEYQTKIMHLAEQTRAKRYFKLCTSYDTLIYDFLRHKIDDGEADAVAQSAKTGVRFFITDDKKCQPFITEHYPNIKLHSTFFLISVADVMGLIKPEDYNKVFIEYHNIREYNNFNSTTKRKHKAFLRNEYMAAIEYMEFPPNRRLVSKKTSVDTILRTQIN